MNVRQNEINEKGEKCYSIKAQLKSDMHSLVRVRRINGGYIVSHYDGTKERFESFDEAAQEFEIRTGKRPPEPEFS